MSDAHAHFPPKLTRGDALFIGLAVACIVYAVATLRTIQLSYQLRERIRVINQTEEMIREVLQPNTRFSDLSPVVVEEPDAS